MATSRSNPINPNPCEASAEEADNWQEVRELFEQVFPRIGCATENWRMTNSVYPSHANYPSCPTMTQHCTVDVTFGGESFTVKLPCPRNRDPNIETGDSVMFQEDFDKNALYIGGHDDPIGTVKQWTDTTAPRGWKILTGAAPAIETRTGKWPTNGANKFILNRADNLLATCDDNEVTIDDHAIFPVTVTVEDHELDFTSTDTTDITATVDCSTDYAYVEIDCDWRDHSHLLALGATNIWGNAQGVGELYEAAQGGDQCTEGALEVGCGGPADFTMDCGEGGYGTGYHYHTMDCEVTLTDPGHFHAYEPDPHVASGSAGPLEHTADHDIPYIVLALIIRYNNAANAVANTVLEAQVCGLV